AFAVARRVGISGEDAGPHWGVHDRVFRRAEQGADAGILVVFPAALGFVGDHRLVVEVDDDGEDIADLMRALILEERARAVPPQRIRTVGGRLRRRHRHVDGLVTGLRGRIFNRRQRRLFAQVGQAVERGTAHERRCGDGGTENKNKTRMHGRNAHWLGGSCSLTAGAAADAISGPAAAMVTRPGPITVAWTVRLDWMLSTPTTSPMAPPSTALPRTVGRMP